MSLNQDYILPKMPYRRVGFTESRITGSGSWNFGSYRREDIVEIYGSKGKITFLYSKMTLYC
jgi:hypothetical protein